ncbi:selenocysteine-specific translation elongation factor [Ornithinimicrobium flavum]|uniref:selenocysteine-specific translation elongation factor n=1 Tax=Ornithinimicrobium flavum TaxID=1288636 RepID=UPI00106F3272|nr:selenocysteine-specific translation elongation factor [Ornithinimicrobium flavum]
MHVLATAGHVDHGKSTLVRALTGMEPDRWAQERARGLTIDLGYVWTRLEGTGDVAFVDVPGHRRFIGNMLAGLGPSPAVLLVVAADEGWRAQTEEHLRAVEALRVRHGLLVVTRADLADPGPALAAARERVARGSLAPAARTPGVCVSAVTGQGMDDLRRAITRLCLSLPTPSPEARVRLWVDRAFTVRGSGTVVTGTLEAGRVSVGDTLTLAHGTAAGTAGTTVTVRGLQSLGRDRPEVTAPARVAVNLRGLPVESVARGDALLTAGAWPLTDLLDARLDVPAEELPQHLTLHVGSSAAPVRLRPLAGRAARLSLARPLPLQAADRAILRRPGVEGALTGMVVADVAPPPLERRGEGARRGDRLLHEERLLASASPARRLATEVDRRGRLSRQEARLLGLDADLLGPKTPDTEVVRAGEHLVSRAVWRRWQEELLAAVDERAAAEPLDPLLPLGAARDRVGVPDLAVLETLSAAAGLEVAGGRVGRPGVRPSLGEAQRGLDLVLGRLAREPFAAPEAHELRDLGLGPRQVAAAVATGQLVRIGDDVLLLPRGPALAMSVLAGLPQPFTTSQARQALRTTRRVAVPLLEHLDARGWTRRLDAGHREVVRPARAPGG